MEALRRALVRLLGRALVKKGTSATTRSPPAQPNCVAEKKRPPDCSFGLPLGQMCSIHFLHQAIYPSEIMPHSPLTIEHSPEHVPLWTDWSPFIKKGILGAVAAAHQATVQIYRLGHESVHPLFRHHVRHARTESDASLLRMQLHVLQGRAARAKLGFYTSEERFSILQIQMARGWSHARTAREFQVCARTIAKWHREFENDTLIKGPRSPVNKFPDYVRLIVLTLKRTFPHLGHRKIAEFLARAGLLLAATTVRRMTRQKKQAPRPPMKKLPLEKPDSTQMVARYPGHIWHADITSIPTNVGTFFSW